jgi:hypothetical protein
MSIRSKPNLISNYSEAINCSSQNAKKAYEKLVPAGSLASTTNLQQMNLRYAKFQMMKAQERYNICVAYHNTSGIANESSTHTLIMIMLAEDCIVSL